MTGLSVDEACRQLWQEIVGTVASNAIVSFRSAVDGRPYRPASDGPAYLFMAGEERKTEQFPGFVIEIYPGGRSVIHDIPFVGFSFGSQYRGILESLEPRRGRRAAVSP